MKKALLAEFFGTAFLVVIVFGSGIMGSQLSGGNLALALLANSLATGAGLFVLIQCLGSISGAHFNPAVSLVESLWGRLERKQFLSYCFMQTAGSLLGVILVHAYFDLDIFQISQTSRSGAHLWLSEFLATFGLICTIFLAGKKHVEFAPLTVALYITSAYWFTSSTAFVNPAITLARIFTDTFCGMAPLGVGYFLLAQTFGALAGFFVTKKLDSC